MSQDFDKTAAITILKRIFELELAGVVLYTYYALQVYGYSRIPIIGWFNGQADESLLHARQAGELITSLGGEPPLGIGSLPPAVPHDMNGMLRTSLQHEQNALKTYYELLACVRDRDVRLEEYARALILQEETHQDEVNKMLRAPAH